MHILFIGGTGNISTDCAAELHRRGHEISVVTRGRSAVAPEYTAIVADRTDRKALTEALRHCSPDVVINFLGFDVPDVETDAAIFADGPTQYIFISSTTVYAKPHTSLPLTEQTPLGNAFSEYARKKQACEEWLLRQHAEAGFPVTIVRPSHTYSSHWIPNPVSSAGFTVAARLLAGRPVFVPDDGQTLWTLTATSDFAVGLAGLAGNAEAVGETFQITGDAPLTWNVIYHEIARALGAPAPNIVQIPTDFICETCPVMTAKLKGDKAEHGVFDNAKIKRFVPDFACSKSFRDGIAEAVAWFRADPARQIIDADIDGIFEKVIGAWGHGRHGHTDKH